MACLLRAVPSSPQFNFFINRLFMSRNYLTRILFANDFCTSETMIIYMPGKTENGPFLIFEFFMRRVSS
jgi:hypothetical protein